MSYNNIFKNWKQNYLIEARIDKVKKKYSGNDQLIDKLSQGDPSGNDKYLSWMAKQAIKEKHSADEVIDVVQKFDDNVQRLQKRDIFQWKFDDLKQKLETLGQSARQEKMQIKDQTVKIYEDENYLFIAPLSTGASCIYGAGTKWCISAGENNQFQNYSKRHQISFIFLFFKDKQEDKEWGKIALCYYPEDKMSYIADKIYRTVTDRKEKATRLRKSLGPRAPEEKYTVYDDLSEEEIYDKVVKSPQEIYNAQDNLVCKVSIPQSLMHEPGIPALMNRYSEKMSCDEKLDELLNGEWTNKFRDICFKSIGKIREKINKHLEEEDRQTLELFKEIESWSSKGGEKPFRYFKVGVESHGMSVDDWESEILSRIGSESEFYFNDAELTLIINYEKLGLRPVKYESIEEKILLNAYLYQTKPDNKYIEMMMKHLRDPDTKETMLRLIDTSIDDRFPMRVSNRVSRAIIESFKEMHIFDDMKDWTAGTIRNSKGEFDPNHCRVYCYLNAAFPDNYVMDYKAAKTIEDDFNIFLTLVKKNLLRASQYEPMKNYIDKQYLFWEPIS